MKYFLLVDIGSTTTKAILCSAASEEGLAIIAMADAPTTVEAPYEDVAIGLNNAIVRLREQVVKSEAQVPGLVPYIDLDMVDGFLLTSSAGGGLQMLVIGLIKSMTGESAERAALGGGGVILDVMAQDDMLQPFERIERIRSLRPDMILLAGGVEGGAVLDVAVLAEMLFQAHPEGRFAADEKLPLIYAGNSELHPYFLEKATDYALLLVENLRPVLDRENLTPTRKAIQQQFMEHVMAKAPGYEVLKAKTSASILPTPLAVSRSLQLLSTERAENILAVDIGGATTDVFSSVEGVLNRTVSANIGMSYSVMNTLKEAGIESIMRWMPKKASELEIRNWLQNKMLRPTTLPHSLLDLQLEQAIAREALRLAYEQHMRLTIELKGNKPSGDWKRSSESFFGNNELFAMKDIGLIIGSGGVISHAPSYLQSMLMLIDGFLPLGWTDILLDKDFTMPHFGALSQLDPEVALRFLLDHSLTPLGICLTPRNIGPVSGFIIHIEPKKGASREVKVGGNSLSLISFEPEEFPAQISIKGSWRLDLGAGYWQGITKVIKAAEVGLIVDLRGRPLPWKKNYVDNSVLNASWQKQLELYTGGKR